MKRPDLAVGQHLYLDKRSDWERFTDGDLATVLDVRPHEGRRRPDGTVVIARSTNVRGVGVHVFVEPVSGNPGFEAVVPLNILRGDYQQTLARLGERAQRRHDLANAG